MVGTLAERRGARGGIVSKVIDIGWPIRRVNFQEKKKRGRW